MMRSTSSIVVLCLAGAAHGMVLQPPLTARAPVRSPLSRAAPLCARTRPIPSMAALQPSDAQPATRKPPGRWRRALRQLTGTLLVFCAGIFIQPRVIPRPANTAIAAQQTTTTETTELSPAARRKLNRRRRRGRPNPVGAVAFTSLLTGSLIRWSVLEAQREDKEERERCASALPCAPRIGVHVAHGIHVACARRIVKETERLSKLQKEFTDIDDGVVSDEDLFSSLKSRMGKGNSTKADGGDGPGDAPRGGGGGDDAPASGGGAATLERPSADEPTTASQEDIDRLKRMFGSTGDDA